MLENSFREQLRLDIAQYVERLFAENPKPELIYHSIHHTHSVVEHALNIAACCNLSDDELLILYAIAWFHDTGHLFAEQKNHEEAGLEIANKFLNNYPQISPQSFVRIERGILATKMPQLPCTLLEEIICDADTYHFGTAEFFVTNGLVQREMQLKGYNVDNWDASTLRMLESHQFHTAYCQQKLNAGKRHNIDFLRHNLPGI